MGVGAADWDGIGAFVSEADLIRPDPANRETYDAGYARYHELYARLKGLH